jgi:tetratricopeptide (TPR) repeat protein
MLRSVLLGCLTSDDARRISVDEETRERLAAIGYLQEDPGALDPAAPLKDPKELIPCIEALHVAVRHYTYGAIDSSLVVLDDMLLAGCPGSHRIYDHIARAEVRLGRYDRIARRFAEIVAAEPGYAKGHFWLGLADLQTGRAPEAVEKFRRAVAIDPGLAIAHYQMGNALEKLGMGEEAVKAWEDAMRSDPAGQTGRLAERSRRGALSRNGMRGAGAGSP